jgi:hypothetical protein
VCSGLGLVCRTDTLYRPNRCQQGRHFSVMLLARARRLSYSATQRSGLCLCSVQPTSWRTTSRYEQTWLVWRPRRGRCGSKTLLHCRQARLGLRLWSGRGIQSSQGVSASYIGCHALGHNAQTQRALRRLVDIPGCSDAQPVHESENLRFPPLPAPGIHFDYHESPARSVLTSQYPSPRVSRPAGEGCRGIPDESHWSYRIECWSVGRLDGT